MLKRSNKTTEYLFGCSKAEFEPEITILAQRRIHFARELLKKLAKTKREEDIERYQAVEKAIKFWEEVLNEA